MRLTKGEQTLLDYIDKKIPLDSLFVKQKGESIKRRKKSVEAAAVTLVKKGLLMRNKEGYLERIQPLESASAVDKIPPQVKNSAVSL